MLLSYISPLVFTHFGLVFVVLFFKQKTAYEMRISDWSSDVCSSDLSASNGSVRAARASRFAAPVAMAALMLPLIAWARAWAPEIGRASCRERVCQYV